MHNIPCKRAVCTTYTVQQNKRRPTNVFLSYLKLKISEIYFFCHKWTLQCVTDIFGVFIENVAILFVLTTTSKVCTPKFESHKICWSFLQNIKTVSYSPHNETSNMRLASGMFVDTKSEWKLGIGIRQF